MLDNTPKTCACKGIRSCLLCESSVSAKPHHSDDYIDFIYCRDCGNKAFVPQFADHSAHADPSPDTYLSIDGVFVEPDIVSKEQETDLINRIDLLRWTDSQSGRRKQDFGPRVNFKKQKVNLDRFDGLPHFDQELLQSIERKLNDRCSGGTSSPLDSFIAVEVCHLEYEPTKGSAIDLHFDDFWVWGQRLVTVNLLSETILNLVLPEESLPVDRPVHRIRIPLTARSLVILWSDARYKYQHSIQREDIRSRRIAITYRELSPEFLPNGPLYESIGKEVINRSLKSKTFL